MDIFMGVIYFLVLMKEFEGVMGLVIKIGDGGCLGFLWWFGGKFCLMSFMKVNIILFF